MLHVGALSLVQLSVVQAVTSGGLMFLAVIAERFFSFHLRRRQWVGLTVTLAQVPHPRREWWGDVGSHQSLGVLALAASVVAFYSSARSLQVGPPLAVIGFTSVAANLIAISGGILVFHDSIGAGTPQIVGRMLAFCLVIAGTAMMPAPTRARTTATDPASARPSPAAALA